MPFISNEMQLRQNALADQFNEENSIGAQLSSAAGILSTAYRDKKMQEAAIQREREKEDRAAALELLKNSINQETVKIKGPTPEDPTLGEGEFDKYGYRFGLGEGKKKFDIEEYFRKKEIDARFRPPARASTSEYNVDQLRKEVSSLPITKDTQKIVSSVNQLQSSLVKKTPLSDRSAIFQYMKILDPTSTVREGEQAQVENARGVPESIMNIYNKTLEGTPLTQAQRDDLYNSANSLAETQLKSFEDTTKTQKDIALKRGYNTAEVFPNFQIQKIPSSSSMPPGAVKVIKNKKTGELRYLDANGNIINGQ